MAVRKISARFDEAEIDRIFADIDQGHLPGAAVGIAIEGLPVYAKGFGLANMELPVLLTPHTRMRVGSTTKHFACLAYLLLCEEGLAGIDDEIGRYVNGLRPAVASATILSLMSHISGIRDPFWFTMAMHGVDRPVTDRQILAYYETIDDVDFAPGTRWRYNNGGYVLLTAAIEKIAGESLDDVLRERIFAPAGMHDTMLRRWDSGFVPNSAALHFRDAQGVFSKTYMGMELSGAGGMVSTMTDMLAWLKHMDAPVIGTQDSWKRIREPQLLASGWSTRYGLGLFCDSYRGVDVVHHAGDVMSGNSQMIKVPSARLDISIGVNRSDVSASVLAFQIIDAMVDGLAPVPEKADYERHTGVFVSRRDGRVVTLADNDGGHRMTVDGGAAIPVSPDETGVLQLPAPAAFLQTSVRIDGGSIMLTDFDDEDRLEPIAVDEAATLGSRVGCYRSDGFDLTMILTENATGATGSLRGRHGWADYGLTPISVDIWRIEQEGFSPISGIMTLDPGGEGLQLDFGPVRHIHLTRAG
ncbi:serine hydrolase domain-containing protein [Novosphingobium colocasiae]|uniref:serine hydrolase domain-containing protein n=1 Tax=Novosphingobium colocasiae TaxID=1256513 RepID=UPI0035AFAD07